MRMIFSHRVVCVLKGKIIAWKLWKILKSALIFKRYVLQSILRAPVAQQDRATVS